MQKKKLRFLDIITKPKQQYSLQYYTLLDQQALEFPSKLVVSHYME
jgi:hypothetical protein